VQKKCLEVQGEAPSPFYPLAFIMGRVRIQRLAQNDCLVNEVSSCSSKISLAPKKKSNFQKYSSTI